MIEQNDLAGSFTLPGNSMTLSRMGYGAMQLAGPGVWGPPQDANTAIAVLREAVESGVNHIDTSDYYGPHVTNQLIKQALYPYAKDLVIVTKIGARRGPDKSWLHALSRQELVDAVHDNLRNLGLDRLDVVNLRVGGITEPGQESIEEPLTVLVELKREGLIRHIGLSNNSPQAVGRSSSHDRDRLRAEFLQRGPQERRCFHRRPGGARYSVCSVFPAGRFHSITVVGDWRAAAASLEATPMQVALAWLLQRSPNILLIPGTSSLEHLRENSRLRRCKFPLK